MSLFQELQTRGFIKDLSHFDKISDILNGHLDEKLTIYNGFDLTADSLHAGHLVPIMLLRRLWKEGHNIIILLGGGTTKIGDPSDKNEMRKMISDEEIAKNKKGILHCFKKYIDINDKNVKVVDNADWLLDINYISFLRNIGIHFTINKMVNLEFVKRRLEDQNPLTFLEFNYMLIQGYDFLHLNKEFNCNMQLGGSDQWGNILQGIELVRRKESKEVYGMTMSLLERSDGKKMGKTASGAVWLHENKLSPFEFYQYFRNIDDRDIAKFFKIFTEISLKDINNMEKEIENNPNKMKEKLAFEIVKLCHGEHEAHNALNSARNLFSNTIDENTMFNFSKETDRRLIHLLCLVEFADSHGNAKRLIRAGGIKINEEKILDENYQIDMNKEDFILSSGKKNKIGIKS